MLIRKININSIYIKTFTYRLIRVISNLILFGVLLGNWTKAFSYNIWLTILATAQYFIFDYFFSKRWDTTIQTSGFVLWFTGLPCSGKTTIADALGDKLVRSGLRIERLDGDIVRKKGLSDDLGFSKEDRDRNINRVSFVSSVLSRNGTGVLASFVSPYKVTRKKVRNNTTNFIEVYVKASPSECAKRDVKGMWKLAKAGKITGFTGYDAPYEEPDKCELVCDTLNESIDESVDKIFNYLKCRRLL